MTNPQRYTVTAALIYANGPIHIGHLAGCYLPADIYARYLRSMDRDVVFISGTDEHGVPITIKAKKEGITPQQVVDKYYAIIKDSFAQFGISFDIYSRTSNAIHHQTAQDFFSKLYEKGVFTEEITEQYYDEEAQQFLADRYIMGTCPNCSNESAYGDQCERCGTSLSPEELINPHSTLSGSKPVFRKTKNWYLPLDKMQGDIEKYINAHTEWKPNVSGQCKSWLKQGLHPRAMTRDLDWGVKVPLKDTDGKVLYVWFDAPIGYISMTKELCEQTQNSKFGTQNWESYWKEKDTKLVHFIGKDNIVFHCIIFPAMLMAHGDYILPDNVPANEFMNLEGDKISTSRNWAVWLHEYLEEFPDKQDVLRYVLTATAPESKDNDFTWKDFQARNNNELVAILGNFVNRTLVLTHKYYDGQVPQYGDLTTADKDCITAMKAAKKNISESIENYRFREALAELMNLARVGNKYLADTEPWKLIKTDAERVKTILYISIEITAYLAALMEPFMPFTAAKLCKMLHLDLPKYNQLTGQLIYPGHQLAEVGLLFDKIEDDAITIQIEKLAASKAMNEVQNTVVAPQKENITFDEFGKMDIRIGTIIAAETVAKTKKLLKLTIDTGIDKRTVVSGIAEYFEPEKIIGQQVSILVNLAPREIKGIESQGMILMAENADGSLAFMQPNKVVSNGGKVS